MNKVLYSVVLKDKQTIPFLLADKDQKKQVLKFDDLFFSQHETRTVDYSVSQLQFNKSNIFFNYDKQINKFFIKEFGIFIDPKDVMGIKTTEIELSGRYYLFAGKDYESSGGFFDLIYVHDNPIILKGLLKNGLYASKLDINWYHIVDMKTDQVIEQDRLIEDLFENGYLDVLGY